MHTFLTTLNKHLGYWAKTAFWRASGGWPGARWDGRPSIVFRSHCVYNQQTAVS